MVALPRTLSVAAAVMGSLLLAACASTRPLANDASQPLHMDCRGDAVAGRPTVILEAGVFGTTADWDNVLADYSRTGRICAYDRVGLGASPNLTADHDALDNAHRLARQLDLMGETAPVILVGHSNGAFYAETFATLYPGRVAGLAYINGVGVDDLDSAPLMSSVRKDALVGHVAVMAGRMGVSGLAVEPYITGMSLKGDAARRKRKALMSVRHLTNGQAEAEHMAADLAAARARGGVSSRIPVVAVISGLQDESRLDDAWRAAQMAPVRRACQGRVVDIAGASHISPLGRDRAPLLAALDWLETPGLADPARPCAQVGSLK